VAKNSSKENTIQSLSGAEKGLRLSVPRGLVFSGIILGFLLAACYSKRPAPCTNHVRSELTSPNGRQRAFVFQRICPADGSVTTDISIVRTDEALPDGNGNVYATDRDIAVRVAWLTDNRLAVYSFADLSKGNRLDQAGNVSIEYSRVMEADLLGPPAESSPSPTQSPP
jgi:hypothetical protein